MLPSKPWVTIRQAKPISVKGYAEKAIISEKEGEPGIVLDDYLEIACNDKSIKILEIQREGKRQQKIEEFVLGSKIKKGSNLNNA